MKAPINATVRSRLLEPGDMASPERPVYALAITDPKWVRAYIAEVDLGRIKPGMSASVTIDSHPDQPIPGRVGYISSVAEFTPKTVQTEELRTSLVYEVRVYVDDPGDRLRLGMPATVRIPLQEDKQFSCAPRRRLKNAAALSGSGLHKRFLVKETGQTDRAVTDVSLEVPAGTLTALGRPGRSRQNHTAADDGGADGARRRPTRGTGNRCRSRSASGSGPHQLYAAALRALRRPERAGESRSVCRSAWRAHGGPLRSATAGCCT